MSDQPKWTPGPLAYDPATQDIYLPHQGVIAEKVQPEDAPLFLAAPDLYAALMALRDDRVIQAVCPSPLWGAMVDALVKARGEA